MTDVLRKAARTIHMRILIAVAEQVKRLNLEVLDDDDAVKILKVPIDVKRLGAGCFVSPAIEKFDPMVENTSDDFGFGAQVTLIEASNQQLNGDTEAGLDEMDRFLLWRERVTDWFLPTTEEPLAGVPEVHTITYEPGFLYDPTAFQNQYDAQAILLRCWYRKQRRQFT